MDTGLKQRLIGASVLIVLAVIFVPMLLDRPEPSTADVGLPTEAQPPGDFNTRVVPLTPPTASPAQTAQPDAAATVADPNRVATVDTNAPARVDAVSGEVVGGESSPAAPSAQAADPGAIWRNPVATPATALPGSTTDPVPATATPTAAPRASAASAPQSVAAAPAAPTPVAPLAPRPEPAAGAGRFVVVFGSFGQTTNANALIGDLRQGGIDARGEPTEIGGKPATRVLAGPYRDRAAAEQIRLSARQVRSDLTANIVEVDDTAGARAPATAAATPAPAAASTGGAGWAVQIGAYQSAADAGAQRDRLTTAGFSAFIDQVRTERGMLYRVRVGPTAQRAGADQLRADVRARLGIDGLVVSHP